MSELKRNTREYYHYLLDSAMDQMKEGDFLLAKFTEVFLKDEFEYKETVECGYVRKHCGNPKTPYHLCYWSS
jgi:hypothetical protein